MFFWTSHMWSSLLERVAPPQLRPLSHNFHKRISASPSVCSLCTNHLPFCKSPYQPRSSLCFQVSGAPLHQLTPVSMAFIYSVPHNWNEICCHTICVQFPFLFAVLVQTSPKVFTISTCLWGNGSLFSHMCGFWRTMTELKHISLHCGIFARLEVDGKDSRLRIRKGHFNCIS